VQRLYRLGDAVDDGHRLEDALDIGQTDVGLDILPLLESSRRMNSRSSMRPSIYATKVASLSIRK